MANVSRPKFSLERRGGGHRQKTPMPKWSHQKELEGLIGQEVTVFLTTNQQINGMLTGTDAFTIQIASSDKSVMTYFKHAVFGYKRNVVA